MFLLIFSHFCKLFKFIFLFALILNSWYFIELPKIKWFILSTHYCLFSLHKVVHVVIAFTILAFGLIRIWVICKKILKSDIFLLYRWPFLFLGFLWSDRLFLKISKEISCTAIMLIKWVWFLLLLSDSWEVRQAKTWKLIILLLLTFVKRIWSSWVRVALVCPSYIRKLRKVQTILWSFFIDLSRKY